MSPPMLIAIVIRDEKLCINFLIAIVIRDKKLYINFKEILNCYLNSQPLSSKKPSIKIIIWQVLTIWCKLMPTI